MSLFRTFLRWLLLRFYKVQVTGLEEIEKLDENVIIVANHTSFLDVILLWAFLPKDLADSSKPLQLTGDGHLERKRIFSRRKEREKL